LIAQVANSWYKPPIQCMTVMTHYVVAILSLSISSCSEKAVPHVERLQSLQRMES